MKTLKWTRHLMLVAIFFPCALNFACDRQASATKSDTPSSTSASSNESEDALAASDEEIDWSYIGSLPPCNGLSDLAGDQGVGYRTGIENGVPCVAGSPSWKPSSDDETTPPNTFH